MESVKEIVSGQDAIDIIECIILMNPDTFDEVFDTLNLCDTGNTKQNFLAMSRRLCGQYLIEDFKLDPRWASMTEIELKEARDRLRNKVIIDLAKINPNLSMRLLGPQNQKQNISIESAENNNKVHFKLSTTESLEFEERQTVSEIFSVKASIISQIPSELKNKTLSKISENKTKFSQDMDNCRQLIQDLEVFANTTPTKLNYSHTPVSSILKPDSLSELPIDSSTALNLLPKRDKRPLSNSNIEKDSGLGGTIYHYGHERPDQQ